MAEGSFYKINGDKLYASEPNRMWNYCGDGSDGALHVTAGTINLSGFKQYSSITVDVGTILNINSYATVLCSGDVTINGTLQGATVATTPTYEWFPAVGGKGRYYNGAFGFGGGASGGLSRYPLFLTCAGVFTLSATGVMNFAGSSGTNGSSYNGRMYGGTGGSGGAFIGSGGSGGASGNFGGSEAGASDIDDYIKTNLLGLRIPYLFGSQGGVGGKADDSDTGHSVGRGGGGGGAGSMIFIKSFKNIFLEAGSSITVAGGAGGNGYAGEGFERSSGGGGGAGGGLVQLLYKTGLTSSGTVTVAGGSGGTNGGGAGDPGAAGTAGLEINCKF